VEGDEGAGGVEHGLEGRAALLAAVVVGAVDDVLVGEGCGPGLLVGREAGDKDGWVEVRHLLGGVLALRGGWFVFPP
jgi:hypothetical protein